MSRVFVAIESALGRRVVIKVLPPELAAGLSIERFRREIQLAAGPADDMLYYTMPLIEGESLSFTSTGLALGTPAYMAPEQATADPHVLPVFPFLDAAGTAE